jgi:hypothetical protein
MSHHPRKGARTPPTEAQSHAWALFVLAGAVKNLELLHVPSPVLAYIHAAVVALRRADEALRENSL